MPLLLVLTRVSFNLSTFSLWNFTYSIRQSTLLALACAYDIFIEAMNLGALWVPSMTVFSVTVTTSACDPTFILFSDLLVMVFLALSKNMVSKHATMCYLDGVKGVIPSSAKGMWPPMIMSPDEVGGSTGLF